MKVFPRSLLLFGLLACGCGGSPPAPPVQPPAAPVAPVAEAGATHVAAPPATPVAPADPAAGPEGKWIGKVPYDVWFDQPLSVAADSTPLAGVSLANNGTNPPPSEPATAESPMTETPMETATPAAPASGAGATDLSTLISKDQIIDEVKLLGTRLTAGTGKLADYNKSWEELSLDGHTLATLAAVAAVHPDAVPWKQNANHIRDLGIVIHESATKTGGEQYRKTKEAWDKALELISGGTADGEAAAAPFSEVIYRDAMMELIDKSFSSVRANINTESRMKEKPDEINREMAIVATMGQIFGTEGYDNVDDEGFQGYLKDMVGGATEVVAAVKADDFSAFEKAMARIGNSCTPCHNMYRQNSE